MTYDETIAILEDLRERGKLSNLSPFLSPQSRKPDGRIWFERDGKLDFLPPVWMYMTEQQIIDRALLGPGVL